MIADLNPYSAYKGSGVPWLGEVPAHWEVKRGKALFRCVDVRSSTGEEELLTVSSERGVVPRSSATVTMFKAESYAGYKLCWPGDLVINSLWAWARGLGVSRHHGIISSAYGVYRLRPPYTEYSAYVHALVRSTPFNWELQVRSKGIWISRLQLTDEAFLGAPVPLPPLPEQVAIVRYLDHADRRIRRYIRAKQKLIALLEEQKQAIIQQAVTGQIDARTGRPYPAYKPSGVELRGERPERQWEPIKIKHLSSLKGRLGWQGLEASEYTSEGPYVVSSAHFRDHKINWVICPHVTHERYEMDENIQLAQGDILLMKDGAAMGKLAFVDELPGLACLNSHLLLFRPLANDQGATYFPQFMFFYMQAECFQGYVQVNGTGATFLGISQESIGNHKVCLPSRAEQVAIVEHLDEATVAIDTTIVSANRQIELLGEYRTRLIADLVTGKLDVREAAAGLPEVDPVAAEFDAPTQSTETGGVELNDTTEFPEELAMENEVII